jgi:hypothetical protein
VWHYRLLAVVDDYVLGVNAAINQSSIKWLHDLGKLLAFFGDVALKEFAWVVKWWNVVFSLLCYTVYLDEVRDVLAYFTFIWTFLGVDSGNVRVFHLLFFVVVWHTRIVRFKIDSFLTLSASFLLYGDGSQALLSINELLYTCSFFRHRLELQGFVFLRGLIRRRQMLFLWILLLGL